MSDEEFKERRARAARYHIRCIQRLRRDYKAAYEEWLEHYRPQLRPWNNVPH